MVTKILFARFADEKGKVTTDCTKPNFLNRTEIMNFQFLMSQHFQTKQNANVVSTMLLIPKEKNYTVWVN